MRSKRYSDNLSTECNGVRPVESGRGTVDEGPALARSPRVAILNNQIMPYRVPLFERLKERGVIEPIVLYSARRAWDRSWSLDAFELAYPHRVLGGFVVRLPKPRYDEWRTLWFNPALLWRLVQCRPDAVVGYEYSVPAVTALLYSRMSGCRYVTWSEMTPRSGRSLSRGQRWTRRVILARSHAMIGTSYAARDEFVKMGVDEARVVVAPQTLDVDWYREHGTSGSRSQNGSPEVLYVGSLSRRKGVTHLLAAFVRLLSEFPTAKLRLVGEGDREAELRDSCDRLGISKQVHFAGFVQPSRLPGVYAGADVCVLPSLEDTFGVVATEALACGVPLVCSQHAGFTSHATDGHDAFIVDPTNHDQTADRIGRLLRDDGLRSRFQSHASLLLRQFEPDHVAQRFEEAVAIAMDASL